MAFQQQDASLLFKHLQALIDVELFTIPLYLTAANSVSTTLPSSDPVRPLQSLAVSVAVQEMYHLQQACNLCNAFNITPVIPKLTLPAEQAILVPHLDPNNQAFYAKLANLPSAITEMIEVETPDPSGKPVTPTPDVTYQSIADLYSATLQLLSQYWATFQNVPAQLDPHFSPDHNQVAYGAFPTRFNYNAIKVRTDVFNTINAITDQGEGSTVAPAQPFQYGTNGKVLPQYQGSKSDRFYTQDTYTHYNRFEQIRDGLQTIPESAFYWPNGQKSQDLPSWAPSRDVLQNAINTIWSFLLDTLQAGFQSGHLREDNKAQPQLPGFNSAMVSFKYLLPMMWQYGACPSFVYSEGMTADKVQAAMDQVDPWCLFHWDAKTAAFRVEHKDQLNACQGLNDCAGRGWGLLSTQPGDGACATAETHTCVGSNACTNQGGCGYFSSDVNGNTLPGSEQWIPGQNSGANTGGCQTPIATRQVFHKYDASDFVFPPNNTPDPTLVPYAGTPVWDRARALLAQKLNVQADQLPQPRSAQGEGVNYDGTQRRTNTVPSST